LTFWDYQVIILLQQEDTHIFWLKTLLFWSDSAAGNGATRLGVFAGFRAVKGIGAEPLFQGGGNGALIEHRIFQKWELFLH